MSPTLFYRTEQVCIEAEFPDIDPFEGKLLEVYEARMRGTKPTPEADRRYLEALQLQEEHQRQAA